MSKTSVKEEAHKIIEKLPDDTTWDDLMYQIYVRQAVDAGLEDSREERVVDVKDVRSKFGLSE